MAHFRVISVLTDIKGCNICIKLEVKILIGLSLKVPQY